MAVPLETRSCPTLCYHARFGHSIGQLPFERNYGDRPEFFTPHAPLWRSTEPTRIDRQPTTSC